MTGGRRTNPRNPSRGARQATARCGRIAVSREATGSVAAWGPGVCDAGGPLCCADKTRSAGLPRRRQIQISKITTVRATAAEEKQSGTLVLLFLTGPCGHSRRRSYLAGAPLLQRARSFSSPLPLSSRSGVAMPRGRLVPFELSGPAGRRAALEDLGIRIHVLNRELLSATAEATFGP